MKTTADTALLEVRHLCRSFPGNRGLFSTGAPALPAVDDVSFRIERGEILGLAGESGSGKSTLARLLAQLIPADQGNILLEGLPLDRMDAAAQHDARRRIQLIFQDPSAALSPRRSILQSLLEPLQHFRIGVAQAHEQMALDALQSVGLDASALRRLPHQFSSGQRQRIGIARAILAQPELIIADEAVSSLDVSVQAQILELLADLRKQRNIAFLFISHDLAVIRQLADRVGIMFRGQLIEQGPSDTLFRCPAHPYTRQLLAAIPDPDPARGLDRSQPGMGLMRGRPAPGCVFADRCPDEFSPCSKLQPAERPANGPAHRVKCHLYPEARPA